MRLDQKSRLFDEVLPLEQYAQKILWDYTLLKIIVEITYREVVQNALAYI